MRRGRADFDPIARIYRVLEYVTLGRALEHTRFRFLCELTAVRSALVLGDGDGRFLAKLLEENKGLRATAVDASGRMLGLLQQRCAQHGARLNTVQTDALSFCDANTEHYDLIVTHFFLDCLRQPEVDELVQSVSLQLEPGALWLLSEFRIPSGGMRIPARLVVRALYFAFRLLTGLEAAQLPDYATALTQSGFTRTKSQLSLGGMLTAELWRLNGCSVNERIPTSRRPGI